MDFAIFVELWCQLFHSQQIKSKFSQQLTPEQFRWMNSIIEHMHFWCWGELSLEQKNAHYYSIILNVVIKNILEFPALFCAAVEIF